MVPRAAKRVPTGADWAFEIAWDGVRALAPMEGTRAHFQHDAGDELDERTKQLLARMPRAVRTSDCVLDGVICSFPEGVVYVVTDLLDLEGASLIDLPWCDRRTRLTGLLDDHVGEVRLSRDYDDGAGAAHGCTRSGPRDRGQAPQVAVPAGRRQRRLAAAAALDRSRVLPHPGDGRMARSDRCSSYERGTRAPVRARARAGSWRAPSRAVAPPVRRCRSRSSGRRSSRASTPARARGRSTSTATS